MRVHRLLHDETAIAARVEQLARQIAGDLPDRTPHVIGLLVGSFIFLADLIRAIGRLGVEPRVDFMGASHYGSGIGSADAVTIYKDTVLDVTGRSVLLVDDILDTGRTLEAVQRHLAARRPAWLRTCVLLDKPSRRVVSVTADYIGFEVPDRWIIGYGLDRAGEGRALPHVAVVE
jgi:hypoxanthine phosphoribosyltransferase